jgi:hypothetical protein
LHGRIAVEIAKHCQIFDDDTQWTIPSEANRVGVAAGDDFLKLVRWQDEMQRYVQAQESGDVLPEIRAQICARDVGPDVTPLNQLSRPGSIPSGQPIIPGTDMTTTFVDTSDLRIDQLRAYEIVVWHLQQTLTGDNPAPLRMILYGEGGDREIESDPESDQCIRSLGSEAPVNQISFYWGCFLVDRW